jgi:hypothetical protein
MTSLCKNRYWGGGTRRTRTATESTFSINIRSAAPATPLGKGWCCLGIDLTELLSVQDLPLPLL